jgi:hypothetical protein
MIRAGGLAIASILLLCPAAPAAEQTVSWSDDACRYSIKFDPARYDETIVQNTVNLIFGPPDIISPSVTYAPNPEAGRKLDAAQVQAECTGRLRRVRQLRLLPLPGIEQYRRALIEKVQDACRFTTIQIRGRSDPKALREYAPAAACAPFVDALEGKTDIMKVFHDALRAQCQRNASPIQCVDREIERSQRPDGMEWVRHFLIGFGWNNCAIKYVTAWNFGGAIAEQRSELERRFNELMPVEKSECDDTLDFQPKTAVLLADIPAGTLATQWNITNAGLFCGLAGFNPGINFYIVGIGAERLSTGVPLQVTVQIDGGAVELAMQPHSGLAMTTVSPDFVRRLMQATRVAVVVKEYNSPKPDVLKMKGAAEEIRAALEGCFQP